MRTLEPKLAGDRARACTCACSSSAFYRNKAAYVVGKVVNGNEEQPFAIAVVHDDEQRLALDAVLLDSASIDILFSLSRAYFMVDMEVPSGYVEFLRTIMPTKPRSEIYSSLGLGKQGKTLFFRDLLHHLHHSEDPFIEAPGFRGQVMHVFTLPSYPYVFKLIRDRFGPTKNTTREAVMQKFQIVKEVDRVGRMVDALEFVDLALPLDRFSPVLLAQLEELTPSSVEVEGGSLIVKHCYVERRMIPLDMYLRSAAGPEVDRVVREYGDTLRELAIANIFPGDLLWRNFGVTRHGRVVCYDYDELEYLTDCVFRRFPAAPDPETRALGRGVVRGRAERRLPGGVRGVPPRRPHAPSRVPPPPPGPAATRPSGRSASGASAPVRWSTSSRTRTRSASRTASATAFPNRSPPPADRRPSPPATAPRAPTGDCPRPCPERTRPG